VAGPTTQLTNDPADELQPAISGSRVVWTQDAGATNGYDIFSLVLGGGPAVDITPFAGGQFFDDVDGHFAVYVDDRGAFVTAVRYDLSNGNAVPLNAGINASRPSVFNPGGGTDAHVAYVARAATSNIIYVPPALFPTTQVPGNAGDNDDSPRIYGDWIVFQRLPQGGTLHQIVAYRISDGALSFITDGVAGDDTSPDINGTTVVFTRNSAAILAVPVTGGAPLQLSQAGAAGLRDRARISGTNVVWDDMRNGVDNDVYYSASTGGGEMPLVTGPGDQFLTDVDANNVVYTDGPVGGTHDIFLLQLVQCNVDANCAAGQTCDVASHTCVAKPQCASNSDCSGGQVCVSGQCVACTSNAQCGNGLICENGACATPQCTSNAQCGAHVCVNNSCVPCSSDAQCSSGKECKQGSCVATDDGDCHDDHGRDQFHDNGRKDWWKDHQHCHSDSDEKNHPGKNKHHLVPESSCGSARWTCGGEGYYRRR
jgi:Cys-rich repeat protein